MIFKAYRSEHPAPLLAFPLLVLLLWLVVPIQGPELPKVTGMPLYEGAYPFLSKYPWTGWLTGYLLALFGGLLCLFISRDLEFPDLHGNLPVLLYPILMALFPSALWAHPSSFAGIFLLFAFWRVMRIPRVRSATPSLFDAGLAIGLGGLFHLPSLLAFPFIWIGGFILRSLNWRGFLWPLIGLVLPFLFQWCWFYWYDATDRFFAAFQFTGEAPWLYTGKSELLSLILWSLLGILALFGFFLMLKELQSSNMQGKKYRMAFFILLFFQVGVAFFAAEFFSDPFAWSLLAGPVTFLLVPVFAKRGFGYLSSFLFYFWLLIVLLNYYASSYF